MGKRIKKGYFTGAQPLRNLRIVSLHKEKGMTFEAIAKQLTKETGEPITRQSVANTYKTWKDVPFKWEDDKAIIH